MKTKTSSVRLRRRKHVYDVTLVVTDKWGRAHYHNYEAHHEWTSYSDKWTWSVCGGGPTRSTWLNEDGATFKRVVAFVKAQIVNIKNPATPRYLVTTDTEFGWWKVEDQFNRERVFRDSSREACHKWAEAKNAEHIQRLGDQSA